eukprot:CAMPEP_0119554062 /NCGR_PEP_ID=MMETSP1352-20130426/6650_1 /TAXON_ID=265584 /ORGANISM="Stauroneis constricta, Strain CCMP1120" /LENGTH=143 /DNA_ID=CAMNT_0007600581 /DNA_START=20 /DNA_END=448 /DNA_ORIENTATION=-
MKVKVVQALQHAASSIETVQAGLSRFFEVDVARANPFKQVDPSRSQSCWSFDVPICNQARLESTWEDLKRIIPGHGGFIVLDGLLRMKHQDEGCSKTDDDCCTVNGTVCLNDVQCRFFDDSRFYHYDGPNFCIQLIMSIFWET